MIKNKGTKELIKIKLINYLHFNNVLIIVQLFLVAELKKKKFNKISKNEKRVFKMNSFIIIIIREEEEEKDL